MLEPLDYAYTPIVTVNQSRPMHNKAEVHQDKLKEMQKRHNIMVGREFNSYCTVSYGQICEGAKENRPANAPPISTTRSADFSNSLKWKPTKNSPQMKNGILWQYHLVTQN